MHGAVPQQIWRVKTKKDDVIPHADNNDQARLVHGAEKKLLNERPTNGNMHASITLDSVRFYRNCKDGVIPLHDITLLNPTRMLRTVKWTEVQLTISEDRLKGYATILGQLEGNSKVSIIVGVHAGVYQNEEYGSGLGRAQQEIMQQAQILLLTNENQNQAAVATGLLVSNEISLAEETADSDGSPPGFPGPPKYGLPKIRRSPRIKQAGTFDFSYSDTKRRKKNIKTAPVQLDYLKSFAPLSDNQTEVLLATAGVELDVDLSSGLKEALKV